MVCYRDTSAAHVQEAGRIGKLAVLALQQFDMYTDLGLGPFSLYYAYVAPLTEKLQLCSNNLQRGFVSGMARGDRSYGETICV